MSLKKENRNKDILYLIELGYSCETIGGRFAISKQRVNQIMWEDLVHQERKGYGFENAIAGWRKDGFTNKQIVGAMRIAKCFKPKGATE